MMAIYIQKRERVQVYVNGVFSEGSTNTAKFSLYVSPYLVANQGGRYTKHIYAVRNASCLRSVILPPTVQIRAA